ncbi:Pr6Pr family membrane protein [Pseudoclavibacter soli]|uniref:Pr6Pr family membrane protein n=1 Tax=Pseudoclavibacter soli TaxID=452623 RepID=UPI000686B779|nr:Pr6Pr family membrane protein [Pseudoclavibacter soli]
MPLIASRPASAVYKSLLSLIGWVSIIATTGLLDGRASWSALEMFTTQSNILCTLYFTVATVRLWAGRDAVGQPFAPVVKGIATMAVTITFLVAWLVLHMSVSFGSAADASLLGLHVVVPLMAVADWVLFDAPGRLRWRDALLWLIAPMLYLVEFAVVLAAGGSLGGGAGIAPDGAGAGAAGAAGAAGGMARTSRAPYPFLDVDSLGVGQVVLNVAALAAGIVVLGLAAIALDRWRGRRAAGSPQPAQ